MHSKHFGEAFSFHYLHGKLHLRAHGFAIPIHVIVGRSIFCEFLMENHRHGKRIGCSVHVCMSMLDQKMERRKGVMEFCFLPQYAPYVFVSISLSHRLFCLRFCYSLCLAFDLFRQVFDFDFVAVTFFIRQMQNACF